MFSKSGSYLLLFAFAALFITVSASVPSHNCKFSHINEGPFYYQGKQVSGDWDTTVHLSATDDTKKTWEVRDAQGVLMHKVLIKNDHITFKNGPNMDKSYVYIVNWERSPDPDPSSGGPWSQSIFEYSYFQLSNNHRCKFDLFTPPPDDAKIKQVSVEVLH